MDSPKHLKTITGYCEPLSLRAGESIRLMASSHQPGPAQLDLVRIICGDPTRSGPGFQEREVPSDLPVEVTLDEQPLGSPAHVLILASATEFGPDMTRTKEELKASISVPSPDPVVRADIVFFETSAGGAVFSVGSISWFGALARNGYDNDVAQITANVVRRFVDPELFALPVTDVPK